MDRITISADGCNLVEAGQPTFPPVIRLDAFNPEHPLMHGESVVVQACPQFGGVIIGVAHSELDAGLFMGVSPDMARSIAAWLLASADDCDGGVSKQ